ncbi:hypothetical protein [Nonomuraea sp. NPDC046570]|uniref:hypothetical protein n=1 Tax=Nonomuraea sp. NPDC046570 TaxID=3155255 RepID=UPI0033DAB3C9
MFKLKTTLAAVAMSTALAGGVVGLGAATTTATASAASVSAAPQGVQAGFGGSDLCKFRFRTGPWHHRTRIGERISRFKIRVNQRTGRVRYHQERGCLRIRNSGTP